MPLVKNTVDTVVTGGVTPWFESSRDLVKLQEVLQDICSVGEDNYRKWTSKSVLSCVTTF